MPERAVLTIATGKSLYLELAATLARSFRMWNRENEIRFVVATDSETMLPTDLDFVEILSLDPNQFGSGFSPKLHLDELAPADQTLFVDADCLCVSDLSVVFERFAGRPVSVVGRTIREGEWFGDVATVCERFGLAGLPRFNGGVYYLERGSIATRVFAKARALEESYDEIGFLRLRGRPNDEVLIAVAMGLHDQEPVPDDRSGFLVPEGDVHAMADRILELVRRPERWSLMGVAGREHVEGNFRLSTQVEKLITFYRGQITTGSRQSGSGAEMRNSHPDPIGGSV